MNKNLSGLGAIIFSSVILVSCGGPPPKQQAAAVVIPVVTYQASEESVTSTDSYPGTVVPINEVELRAEVGGYITSVLFNDGQQVTKGQKLYEIDRTRYDSAYRQADVALQIAKANRDKAAKDAARYTKLAEQDAIAKQRVDYAVTDLANAESLVASAESAVARAAVDVRRASVIAPMNGMIGISQVKLGALISPGSTLLNTISTTNPIAVDIAVGQDEIPRFVRLQKNAGDLTFTLQLAGQTLPHLSGQVLTIDRAVDPTTGTIKVRISYPNASGILRSGMSCTVQVLNQDTGKQLTIPNKAVTEQMGEFYVYVIGDSSKVNQRKVLLGGNFNDKVVVRDGLKAGETIVSDGVQNLKQGAKVLVGDASQAQQKPAGK